MQVRTGDHVFTVVPVAKIRFQCRVIKALDKQAIHFDERPSDQDGIRRHQDNGLLKTQGLRVDLSLFNGRSRVIHDLLRGFADDKGEQVSR